MRVVKKYQIVVMNPEGESILGSWEADKDPRLSIMIFDMFGTGPLETLKKLEVPLIFQPGTGIRLEEVT